MVDQVKVIEIGADAIEAVLQDAPAAGLAYPPKLMHAVVAALGRHGYIIEDRYEEDMNEETEQEASSGDQPKPSDEDYFEVPASCLPDSTIQPTPGWISKLMGPDFMKAEDASK